MPKPSRIPGRTALALLLAAASAATLPAPAKAAVVGPSGEAVPTVRVETIQPGSGESPAFQDVALVHYKGMLTDGTVFDQANHAVLALDGVVDGFAEALMQMQRGGKYKAFIPAAEAYGAEGAGPIPPNADVIFEVELVDFKTRAELEQMQAANEPPPQR